MQSPNHFERERASTIENLVHPVATSDEGNEIARLKPALVHMILDRLYRIRKIEPIMLPLPGFHQCDQYVEPIALGRVAPRSHQALDLLEGAAVITLGRPRADRRIYADFLPPFGEVLHDRAERAPARPIEKRKNGWRL